MELLKSCSIHCPCCGEALELSIDCSVQQQSYVEDCQVCCRPIQIDIDVDDRHEPRVRARAEND